MATQSFATFHTLRYDLRLRFSEQLDPNARAQRRRNETLFLMAATTKVALGIVGCGAITEMYYTPSVRELERAGYATVAAIFDPSAERVAKIGAQLTGAR